MSNVKELKESLALSCNILAYEGHWDNILGHVSVRIPGNERILMKPHSFGFEEIRPEHVIEVDLDGNKVGGKYPSSARKRDAELRCVNRFVRSAMRATYFMKGCRCSISRPL